MVSYIYMLPFLKYLSFKITGTHPSRGADYDGLLPIHNMDSLVYRRDIPNANFLVKLVKNKIDS